MKPKSVLKAAATAAIATTAGLAAHDLFQKEHALRRNFPILARARYALERIGPELRQYIVTGNDEERPFSRDQRRWVYASAKAENNYFAFGTDNDVENTTYPVVKHRTFSDVVPSASLAIDPSETLPSAKILGGPRGSAAGLSSPLDRQRLSDVVRIAEPAGDPGHQPRCQAGRIPP